MRLDAKLIGHDLGQHRGRALAVGRGAGDEEHAAPRIHAQHRPLVGTEPGEQDIRGDADAEQSATRSLRALDGLRGAALVVPAQHQRGVERALVVAAVVGHGNLRRRGSDLPRKLVAPDEVASSELAGIDPERLGEVIEGTLDREHRLGLAGPAIRCRRRLAGESRAHPTGVIADAIGSGQAGGGD